MKALIATSHCFTHPSQDLTTEYNALAALDVVRQACRRPLGLRPLFDVAKPLHTTCRRDCLAILLQLWQRAIEAAVVREQNSCGVLHCATPTKSVLQLLIHSHKQPPKPHTACAYLIAAKLSTHVPPLRPFEAILDQNLFWFGAHVQQLLLQLAMQMGGSIVGKHSKQSR